MPFPGVPRCALPCGAVLLCDAGPCSAVRCCFMLVCAFFRTYSSSSTRYMMRSCCSHINWHNQVRGHGIGSSHSEAEEYPRKKTQTNQRRYTHISQLTQFMPPLETYKSEIGSQLTICQVYTGAYVSLLAPEKPTIPLAPRKDYHVYEDH